jgi:DNA polymerase
MASTRTTATTKAVSGQASESTQVPEIATLADAARLVRQQAVAGALLGVDTLPVAPAREPARASVGGVTSGGAAGTLGAANQAGAHSPRTWSDDPVRHARAQALERVRTKYLADAPHERFGYEFTNIVFGEGDPAARLMLIGEAPGAEEDRTGRPFVGRAGQLLEKMLVAMGLAREAVYIANVLKVRPPNNATPTVEEREACKAYLFEQVAAVRPQVIVTLGLPASQTVLASDQSMGRLRGVWASFSYTPALQGPGAASVTVPVMPTYHPAYLLRSYTPENRKAVWSDLQKVMDRLNQAVQSSGQ